MKNFVCQGPASRRRVVNHRDFIRLGSVAVATHSMHIKGKAVDIRTPGCRLTSLRHAALALHDGGVGIYPVSDFVHTWAGRVRRWRFPATARHARPS
jgi:uncharacterized protein YcbK (DUF882 family)